MRAKTTRWIEGVSSDRLARDPANSNNPSSEAVELVFPAPNTDQSSILSPQLESQTKVRAGYVKLDFNFDAEFAGIDGNTRIGCEHVVPDGRELQSCC